MSTAPSRRIGPNRGNQNQHTLDHIDCPACEETKKRAMQITIEPAEVFEVAAERWLQSRNFREGVSRSRYIATSTLNSYAQYIHALDRFFSRIPLNKIHIGHLRQYQEQRSAGELGVPEEEVLMRMAKQKKMTIEKLRTDPEYAHLVLERIRAAKVQVSSNKINQELGTLIRILRRANLWTSELDDGYEALMSEEPDIPRALSPAEQERILQVASSRTEWQFVYWYMLIALRTTLGNHEQRGLRLGDINLSQGIVCVQAAHGKNKYRVRTIPLAPDALWAAQHIVDRARGLGSSEPQHYAMPFRWCKGSWDPTRPMSNSGIKKPWEAVRSAAGVPWLRIHDLRHTAITRLAESGTPIPVIMSMAGHISRRMMQHYTQISEQAQRTAVMAAYQHTYYDPTQKRPPDREKEIPKNHLTAYRR
jgi:integrase